MSRLRVNKITTPGTPSTGKGDLHYNNSLSPAALAFLDEAGALSRLGGQWVSGNTGAVGGGFAADTYMAGVNIGAVGGWKPGMIFVCEFDMVKTAAGTATPILTVRMGTAGTTSDGSVQTFTHTAGTAAADTGKFRVVTRFDSVGSGTSAVLRGYSELKHGLASTGLTSNGTAGYELKANASSGFNSTTQNIIGVSFNGGASFVGTNIFCCAFLSS